MPSRERNEKFEVKKESEKLKMGSGPEIRMSTLGFSTNQKVQF